MKDQWDPLDPQKMQENTPEVKTTKLYPNNECITQIYWKDFKHLKPYSNKQTQVVPTARHRSLTCRILISIWLKEVLKGSKKLFYEGSLHGVKYIFEPSFGRKERATWVLIVGVSIGFCIANIIQLFAKWNSSPFVNVMDSLPTPVWAVPFPSVVLCPQLHVKLSFARVSELDAKRKFYASLTCPQMSRTKKTLENRLDNQGQEELQEFIIQASLKCPDMVKKCYWGSTEEVSWMSDDCCEQFFTPVFTNYGLCYAFNTLPLNGMSNSTLSWHYTFDPKASSKSQNWSLDSGYPQVFSLNDRPFRAMAAGEQYGFGAELFLNSSEHQFECDGSGKGFTVLISSPTDHMYTSTVIRLPMDRMTSVEVSPLTYKTDSTLRNLDPEKRQCYFQNEKKLQYYAVYTDSNCKNDLLIKEVRRKCDCVAYNWPRRYVYEPICTTTEDLQCLSEVKAKLEEKFLLAYFAENEEHKGKPTSSTCYPSCNDIIYSYQVFYSNLMKDPRGESPPWGQAKPGEVTKINVHFYDDMFLGLHRHAQYDDYYFVGAIGGLLSLFLGFSIISMAELVYFVILGPLQAVFGELYHYHVQRWRN